MRDVQNIVYGQADQIIYFDVPDARPSAVTSVEVFPWDVSDDDTPESAVGSPSIESLLPVTINGNAGSSQSDPRSIPVSDVLAGFITGRRYLITNISQAKEWIELETIGTATVGAKHPLHNDYTNGSSIETTRIYAAVDLTWASNDENLMTSMDLGGNPMYRARWVYAISGVPYVADTYFNLVRYAPRHGVQPQDVEVMLPGWLDALPTDHRSDQGRRIIDDAYRAVRIDLHQVDMAASAIAESEIIDELVRYKTVQLSERARYLAGGGDQLRVSESERWYSARLDSLVRIVSRVPVRDSTGAATPVQATGLSRR